ncbi:MAG: exodeoxyribonuclease VII small subunit [Lachnospiraceae bacterium]|nr:exodeoxyribonuclease VII small subunit [Lachnospiraceae bacterium]
MAENEKKDMSIDELLTEAEERISSLEGGKLSLEEAFSAYREGMELLKQSEKKIDRVEKQVKQLMENGELVPFEEAGEGDGADDEA